METYNVQNAKHLGITIVIGLVLGLLLIIGFTCYEIVPTGHRGIITRFGKVDLEQGSIPEGLYFINPITTKVHSMDVRIQKMENSASSYSKDAQIVDVKSTINFYLEKDAAHTVFESVGDSWQDKLIRHVLEGTIKEVTGQYIAVDLIAERGKITSSIKEILTQKLAEQNIILTHLEMNNLDFDDSFEQAVKNKVIAVEQAKEAQNKTVKIQEEATQKVIAAEAEAKSMRIRSAALSQNKSLVEYEAVQKWDGKLPEYMLGNSVPFINMKK